MNPRKPCDEHHRRAGQLVDPVVHRLPCVPAELAVDGDVVEVGEQEAGQRGQPEEREQRRNVRERRASTSHRDDERHGREGECGEAEVEREGRDLLASGACRVLPGALAPRVADRGVEEEPGDDQNGREERRVDDGQAAGSECARHVRLV
jgi:hypothetical protein